MDSEDDMYDSYDGEYLEDSDDYGGFSEDIDEDGGFSEDIDEDGEVLEDIDLNGGASDDSGEDGVLEEVDEEGGVSEDIGQDGGVLEDIDEDGDSLSDSEEDEDDVDYGFVNDAADDPDGPDFSSGRPQGKYTLEFDGASKGNPGNAGAGAILRNPDGSVAHEIMKGLGVATNNAAEYEALNQGLKYAQSQGIDRIQVKGDSQLVCKQVNGDWKTRSKNLVDLNKEAKDLKSNFKEFSIDYIPRASNSEADALANDATKLPDGKCVSR